MDTNHEGFGAVNIKRFYIALILLFTILAVGTTSIIFLSTPLVSENTRYPLHPGTTLKTLTEDLNQQGIVKHPFFFTLLARLRGDAPHLKAGVYLIRPGTTPSQLLDQVTSGSGLLYHAFTIIPGWTFQQLRTALNQATALQHTTEKMNAHDLLTALGGTIFSLEGEFFPDTYYYPEGSTDLALLKRAFNRMQLKAQEAWEKRDAGLPFKTLDEALIAASLVEKEAHLSFERPVIAGVLVNRLYKKMLLQFDPTIIYGLNQWTLEHPGTTIGFNSVIRKQDLQFDTPYNTYLHPGLPPTAIAMPSMDAIHAVLHPVQRGYFYFVATGSGGHQFSQTLDEHHLAVIMQRYHTQGFFNFMRIKAYLLKRFSQEKT